jgi:predicted RNA-binding Zn-ribbon protein involved in translation (DUF1610 family)
MSRKRRTSFLEDVYTVASMLPWWASIVLAAISFAGFHMLAGMKSAASSGPEAISTALWAGVGFAAQVIAPLVFLLAAVASGFGRAKGQHRSGVTYAGANRRPLDTSRWGKELLDALEWKRFEHLCAGYFETLGFKSKVAREGPDGGVDIHLYAEGSSVPSILVQCKAWKTYTVGVKGIRELLGAMTAAGVSEGMFITTSGYTAEARQFAAANNIDLIDGEDLLRKIAATRPEDGAALLELATAGDFTTPTCPSCGIKMVERVARKTGKAFWGCTGYPNCGFTMPQRSS